MSSTVNATYTNSEKHFQRDEAGSNHFIERCKKCNTVISQCRCMSQEKTQVFGVCKKCKELQE